MKSFVIVALCVALAHACPHSRRAVPDDTNAPLQVQLSRIDNSRVRARVVNTASRGYNLHYKGSVLDKDSPADKFGVHGSATRARFNGVSFRIATSNLSDHDFMPIRAGQTIQRDIDLAELYEVGTTDTYTIRARGAMPYANIGSTELTGHSVPYTSNALTMDIDGDQARSVPYAINLAAKQQKRTALNSNSCPGDRGQLLQSALKNCADLASNAARTAASGADQLFSQHFHTDDPSVRNTVASRLNAVAESCAARSSDGTSASCTDVYGMCSSGLLAYTLPSTNQLVFCDPFYQALPPLSQTCDGQDQATTVLHEETHAPAVFSPPTVDYAYGHSADNLPTQDALMNADSYAMYANALYLGC
ncbi:Neutral protease 2 [Lecanosticta acicola]|uniref:Neutral protease 2 n=1 Tax=Lecanosticta acicola TaxID=111012 RepID=A0AAI8Z8M4_9PEZI|nr:Neutral protease 2 [Lecanosticta acicola]